TVSHINSNTAFLGSIIAGNGINYPLLFLAYYRICPPSLPLAAAICEAARRALPGTLAAAATASAAYAGPAISSVKGFSQFGWLGAVGMVTTWAFSFAAAPIAIAILKPPRASEEERSTPRFLTRFFASRSRSAAIAIGVVVTAVIGASIGVGRAARDGIYEWD